MAKRIRTRLINMVIAGIGAVIMLVFLLSYSETGSPPNFTPQTQQPLPPSYYLVNARSKQFNPQGKLDSIATSESIQHDPRDNSAKLQQPFFTFYKQGRPAWTLQAESAHIDERGQKIVFQQRVVISSSDQQTQIKTPQLVVFPDKKLAKTDQPVTLLNLNGFTRAIGLTADFHKNEIHLLNQVRGQYNGVPKNNGS